MRIIVALLLLCGSVARAQAVNIGAVYYVSGERAFEVATELRQAQKEDQAYDMYTQAITLFSSAYQSNQILFPEIAYNIALCYWRIDAPFMAQIWLRRYYKGLRRSEHPTPDADRLTKAVIQAIELFEDEIHYDFRCDVKRQYCGYSTNWGKEGQ